MASTKQRVPTWAVEGDQHWEKTPIWDAEFAERWDALHAELTEPVAPAAPARKPRQKTTRR